MNNSAIHNMKQQQFVKPSLEEWKDVAERSLKGKSLESLKTETIEGITLELLYTHVSETKNIRPTSGKWLCAQPSSGETGSEWLVSMRDSLTKGNEALFLDGRSALEWNGESLNELAKMMTAHPIAFIHIQLDNPVLQVFERIPVEERHHVSGLLLANGFTLPSEYSHVRDSGIDLESIHMQGADSVTELALALSIASDRASDYEDFNEFASKVFFRMPADTHFFMEISKFRAFRSLWTLFSSAYKDELSSPVPLFGFTSLRSYSKVDPYVNLLRAANSAFSAVLGGADWFTVYPYNELTGQTPQSLRYARNMQLIIAEETHAEKVIDPSGGSYFIEQLTNSLMKNAWKRFLEIESMGGTEVFLKSDILKKLAKQRKEQVATGAISLIGTNVYADPEEWNDGDKPNRMEQDRPAYSFEALRKRTANQQLKIAIIPFGDLKSYKSRADFASSFLATGGLKAKQSPAFDTGKLAAEWIANEKPDYAILVASPDKIKHVVPEVLASKPLEVIIDVAGMVEDSLCEEWIANGLDGFVYNGQNRIEKITQVLDFCRGGS